MYEHDYLNSVSLIDSQFRKSTKQISTIKWPVLKNNVASLLEAMLWARFAQNVWNII